MELTAKDAARLLGVTENELHRWADDGTVPCYRIKDKVRFNRVELLEWATSRRMKVAPEFFKDDVAVSPLLLTDALRRGGVHRDVAGATRAAVLQDVCGRLTLPPRVNRSDLFMVLQAREAEGSTGIGDGLALPHPRKPIVLGLTEPLVGCAYLKAPVDFGAADGKPVHTMFVIVASTVRNHLQILSHLMCALQDPPFRAKLDSRADFDMLGTDLARIETAIAATMPGGSTA